MANKRSDIHPAVLAALNSKSTPKPSRLTDAQAKAADRELEKARRKPPKRSKNVSDTR